MEKLADCATHDSNYDFQAAVVSVGQRFEGMQRILQLLLALAGCSRGVELRQRRPELHTSNKFAPSAVTKPRARLS